MSMQKGAINVQTENILPIIKRYLYADQEIFLRELVANAVDATQKLKTLADRGEATGELGDTTISVSADPQNRTLTIADKGIGMTFDEVERYITQVAFSGAREFAAKYENAKPIIGHFGLGFYSAFMVADKVEILTKSYKVDAPAVHWVNDGGTEYEIGEAEKADGRGTTIILHLNADADEYLQEHRIQELLNKYCRFLPVEIQFGETNTPAEQEGEPDIITPNIINDTHPIWTKNPADLTDEDYLNFYRTLYPYQEDPLFWIHLNVDYPFNLTGVLYFPKMGSRDFDLRRDRIHLYCRQVFVTDQVENIVPDFLMLLHGIIDSPDIPLNVSRSYLQSDPEVKKISQYITRKVADKLDEIFRKDRELFNQKWEHISVLIKYGMLTNDKFFEKAQHFCLYENTKGELFTADEYREKTTAAQTDKNNKLVWLYTDRNSDQKSYIQAANERGYDVLQADNRLDPHFIALMEQKLDNITFKRVDADPLHLLIEKDETPELVLTDEQQATITSLFTQLASQQQGAMVQLKALTPQEPPVFITKPEFLRRMRDMANIAPGASPYGTLPDSYNIVVNGNHPLVLQIVQTDAGDTKNQTIARQLLDLALLQQNMLKGDDLATFIQRSIALI